MVNICEKFHMLRVYDLSLPLTNMFAGSAPQETRLALDRPLKPGMMPEPLLRRTLPA